MSNPGSNGTVGLSHHLLAGPWKISGTTSELSVPGRYPIALLNRETLQPFRRMWSDADGAYTFNKVTNASDQWLVVLLDYGTAKKNAKASDQLSLVADTAID